MFLQSDMPGQRTASTIDERYDKPIYVPERILKGVAARTREYQRSVIRYIMAYTGFDGSRPRVAITSIKEEDFLNKNWNWTPPAVLSPDSVDDKDACILPEKIQPQNSPHGKEYLIIHRVSDNICGDYVPTLDFEKQKIDKCIDILAPRTWHVGRLESRHISAPPVKTPRGWFLIYHGVSTTPTYRIGAACLT